MRTVITKWGNSAAVQLPASALASAGIAVGDAVKLHGEDGRIIVEKAKPQPITLEWLIEGITPGNVHPETDWGLPVGREIW